MSTYFRSPQTQEGTAGNPSTSVVRRTFTGVGDPSGGHVAVDYAINMAASGAAFIITVEGEDTPLSGVDAGTVLVPYEDENFNVDFSFDKAANGGDSIAFVYELRVLDPSNAVLLTDDFTGNPSGDMPPDWTTIADVDGATWKFVDDSAPTDWDIYPDFLESASSVYAPTLLNGLTPDLVASATVVYSPGLFNDPIVPDSVAASSGVFVPTLGGSSSVDVGFLSSGSQVFAPFLEGIDMSFIVELPDDKVDNEGATAEGRMSSDDANKLKDAIEETREHIDELEADVATNATAITTEAASRASADTSEATTRAAADTALTASIAAIPVKASVRIGTLSNISLSGALTHDGVTIANGDRVGVFSQTTASQNGIYIASTSGAWARASDADASAEFVPGMLVFVLEGTVNGGKLFALTNMTTPTLGSTNITFSLINPYRKYDLADRPAVAHALDDEFDVGTSISANWTTIDSGLVGTAIDPYASVASTVWRASHNVLRRSQLLFQVGASTFISTIRKSLGTVPTNQFIWMRAGAFNKTSPSTNDSGMGLILSNASGNFIGCYVNIAGSARGVYSGGADVNLSLAVAGETNIEYVGIQKVATVYYLWVAGITGTWRYLTSYTHAGTTLDRVGFNVTNTSNTSPGSMIAWLDFVRVYDGIILP